MEDHKRNGGQILECFADSPIFKSFSTKVLANGMRVDTTGPYIWIRNVCKSMC